MARSPWRWSFDVENTVNTLCDSITDQGPGHRQQYIEVGYYLAPFESATP
jgi:hypothetical protein